MSIRVLLKVLLGCSGFRILFSDNGLSQLDTPQALQRDEAIRKTI